MRKKLGAIIYSVVHLLERLVLPTYYRWGAVTLKEVTVFVLVMTVEVASGHRASVTVGMAGMETEMVTVTILMMLMMMWLVLPTTVILTTARII